MLRRQRVQARRIDRGRAEHRVTRAAGCDCAAASLLSTSSATFIGPAFEVHVLDRAGSAPTICRSTSRPFGRAAGTIRQPLPARWSPDARRRRREPPVGQGDHRVQGHSLGGHGAAAGQRGLVELEHLDRLAQPVDEQHEELAILRPRGLRVAGDDAGEAEEPERAKQVSSAPPCRILPPPHAAASAASNPIGASSPFPAPRASSEARCPLARAAVQPSTARLYGQRGSATRSPVGYSRHVGAQHPRADRSPRVARLALVHDAIPVLHRAMVLAHQRPQLREHVRQRRWRRQRPEVPPVFRVRNVDTSVCTFPPRGNQQTVAARICNCPLVLLRAAAALGAVVDQRDEDRPGVVVVEAPLPRLDESVDIDDAGVAAELLQLVAIGREVTRRRTCGDGEQAPRAPGAGRPKALSPSRSGLSDRGSVARSRPPSSAPRRGACP